MLSTIPNAAIPAGLRKKAYDEEQINGAKKHAAGIVFVSPEGRILLLKRSDKEENFAGHWGLPGGGVDEGETPAEGAAREAREEMGAKVDPASFRPFHKAITPTGMAFHTFARPVGAEFKPKLNAEHTDHKWADLGILPRPMHPAVERMLQTKIGLADDMSPKDWQGLRDGFLKWLSEEKTEVEHAEDAKQESEHTAVIKFDGDFDLGELMRALWWLGQAGASRGLDLCADDSDTKREMEEKGYRTKFGWDGDGADKIRSCEIDGVEFAGKPKKAGATDSALQLAMDEESVRSIDQDGHLHVAETNVCKACVSPYKGSEIPNYEGLGLDPDETYQMLRPPEELERAFPTINGKPLMRKHVATSADDHQKDDVVGAVGTTARWEPPYIKNGLTIWPGKDILEIEAGSKYQLSPGYHYTALMEPGVFEGERYDGKMVDISFNHLAIVEEGRQGPDVVVADSAIETQWGVVERALLGI